MIFNVASGVSLNRLYPVGSIYLSTVDTSPASFLGGTWERLKDVFLLAAGDAYPAGATGGEAEVTLTVEQIPSHGHALDIYAGSGSKNAGQVPWASGRGGSRYGVNNAGGGQSHNNMPPYLAVYAWQRVE